MADSATFSLQATPSTISMSRVVASGARRGLAAPARILFRRSARTWATSTNTYYRSVVGDSQRLAFERRARERALGERLAAARRKAGMRQSDVGKKLGYSQSRVAKFEIGERRLTLVDAADLCSLYGISILDLLEPVDAT